MSELGQRVGRAVPQWLRFLIALLLWVLVASAVIAATGTEGSAYASLIAGACVAVALLGFAWILPPAVPFRPLTLRPLLRSWAVFAPCWVVLLVGYLWFMRVAVHPVEPQEGMVVIARGAPSARLGMSLAAIVVAPVIEELLFRGYLQSALAQFAGAKVALVGSALAFGLAHGLAYAFPLACVGLWLGWLRQRYASLLTPMLGHALHNGLMVAVTLLWPQSVDWLYHP
jgi:membrane protease YdiL (CAAX protease family)